MRFAYFLTLIVLVSIAWFLVYVHDFIIKLSKAISFDSGPELFWSWVIALILTTVYKTLLNSRE
jgi:hypothetical protein